MKRLIQYIRVYDHTSTNSGLETSNTYGRALSKASDMVMRRPAGRQARNVHTRTVISAARRDEVQRSSIRKQIRV